MELILLLTPLHTGSGFLQFFLSLHPEIGVYCTLDELDHVLGGATPRLYRTTIRELAALGYRRKNSNDIRYQLVAEHLVPSTFKLLTDRRFSKVIVSIRSPLSVLRTAIWRDNDVHEIFESLLYLPCIKKECFLFCVDQWKDNLTASLGSLDYLGLLPTDETIRFLKEYPVISPTKEKYSINMSHWKKAISATPKLVEFYMGLGYENIC